MYIVPLAWLYVALMMAVAEATSSTGTVLGAVITFVLYGLLPIGLVSYVLTAPARARAIKEKEHEQAQGRSEASKAPSALQPDAGGEPAADPVAPVRKEP